MMCAYSKPGSDLGIKGYPFWYKKTPTLQKGNKGLLPVLVFLRAEDTVIATKYFSSRCQF